MAIIIQNESHLRGRLVALVISVLIALASGTPYLYGVYAPQLITRVGLTTSDSATISLCITVGTSVGGLLGGLLIDHLGPQTSIMMGAVLISVGYFGMNKVYEHKIANLLLICSLMIVAGFGSITCFFATIKAATANFPKHRGGASALPVSAYGFAATIYSFIFALFFSDNAGNLLEFLAIFCGSVAFVGSFFVHIYHDHHDEERRDEEQLIPGPADSFFPEEDQLSLLTQQSFDPEAASTTTLAESESLNGSTAFWGVGERTPGARSDSEASSLLSISNTISTDQPPPSATSSIKPITRQDSIRGTNLTNPNMLNQIQLLKIQTTTTGKISSSTQASKPSSSSSSPVPVASPLISERATSSKPKLKAPWTVIKHRLTDKIFLTNYLIVSITSGIGQMYIYSVGFIVTAQYYYGKDPPTFSPRAGGGTVIDPEAAHLQAIQVSIISIASFSGRLIAGFVSDFLHKQFHIQRLWVVQCTILLLSVGQYILVMNVSNVVLVTVASTIVGGCYGLIFGTYPAVIADTFGTRTFSTTWGLICTGPLLTLYGLNKYFGEVYDDHTNPDTGICYLGNGCYKLAFKLGILLCFVVFFINLGLIYHQRKRH